MDGKEIRLIEKELNADVFNKLLDCVDNPQRMQVVKTYPRYDVDGNVNVKLTKHYHKRDILQCLILSKQSFYDPICLNDYGYCLSGVEEQSGIVARDYNDIVIIRGDKYFALDSGGFISSEVCFQFLVSTQIDREHDFPIRYDNAICPDDYKMGCDPYDVKDVK